MNWLTLRFNRKQPNGKFNLKLTPCLQTCSLSRHSTHHVTMKPHHNASQLITSIVWNVSKHLIAQLSKALKKGMMLLWEVIWTWWLSKHHPLPCFNLLLRNLGIKKLIKVIIIVIQLMLVLLRMVVWNLSLMVMLLLWSLFLLFKLLSVLVFVVILICRFKTPKEKQLNNKQNFINSSTSSTSKWLMKKLL